MKQLKNTKTSNTYFPQKLILYNISCNGTTTKCYFEQTKECVYNATHGSYKVYS